MIVDVESLIGKRITAYLIGEKFDELTGKLVKAEQGRLTIEDSTGCWFVYEYESIDYIVETPAEGLAPAPKGSNIVFLARRKRL